MSDKTITQSKLLDKVKNEMRAGHYSPRTEESYTGWIKRLILFHNKRHPKDMGKEEIEKFLNYLTLEQHVSHLAREI